MHEASHHVLGPTLPHGLVLALLAVSALAGLWLALELGRTARRWPRTPSDSRGPLVIKEVIDQPRGESAKADQR